MLDTFEKLAKIFSLIAIPIVLWWLGSEYQSADGKAKTAVEYVKLSVSIVSNQNEVDPDLYKWASAVLKRYSEVKFSETLEESLATGKANISPSTAKEGWFAVIGSMETIDQAKSLIQKLSPRTPDSLKKLGFQIHKTKISKLFAVTIGGEISKSTAIEYSSIARNTGWVPDAFAERNRGWSQNKI